MNQPRFVAVPWQSERYRQAVDLRHRVLRVPLGLSFSAEDLALEQFQTHYVALDGDQLIGCITVNAETEGTAKLRQMAVEPTRQRCGFGTLMVRHVERELVQQKISLIKLHARKNAIGFYERLGYVAEGEEFMEVTLPHVLMTKRLKT